MNIAITFRHLESTEAIKVYAQEKVGKLQRFLRSPLKANVTLSVEKGQQMAEVLVNAGSEHYTAKESNENMYAAIDKVIDKLEHQIHSAKGAKISSKRGGMSAGEFARVSAADLSAMAGGREES
jgi:putative sigma-54 modulation protein